MRILMVAPVAPFPPIGGAPMRNYQLLRHLARRHQVSLVAGPSEDPFGAHAALSDICEQVSLVNLALAAGRRKRRAQLRWLASSRPYLQQVFSSAPMQSAVDAMLHRAGYDIVQIESALLASLRIREDARLVLDEHNIEYELLRRISTVERSPLRRWYNWLEYRKMRVAETAAWGRVDGCTVTSDRELGVVRSVAPGKPVRVVPNGVDLESFTPSQEPPDPNSIVFTGRLDYRPNTDAVLYFVRQILPRVLAERPSTVFTIVGTGVAADIKSLAGPNVVVTGRVPDVRPYLARARTVIAPLRMGGGTRLKLLEAMAMGKAVVSTAIGCEGLAIESGHHLVVADDPAMFARAVVGLMADEALARRLGQAARVLVERRYGWASITDALEDFYGSIIEGQRRQALDQRARQLELSG